MVLSKHEIKRRLMEDVFSKANLLITSLEIKDGKFVSPRRKRRYYSKFDTAKECICDLIDFYNEEKTKSDRERKREERLKKQQSNSLPDEDPGQLGAAQEADES